MLKLQVYTDGSCTGKNERGADNTGGWGAVFFQDGLLVKMLHNYSTNTTNNREELKAIIETIKELFRMAKVTDGSISATIYSDSSYCVNIATNWMFSWQKNGWTRPGGKTIENLDLVRELFQCFYLDYSKIFPKCQINIVKIAGHNGIIGNELADALATHNTKKIEKLIGRNPEILGCNINELDVGDV